MSNQVWSWVLGFLGVTGLWLLADDRTQRAGWTVGICIQAVWFTYAVVSEQWGFLVSATAFAIANTRGLIRWHRKQRPGPGRAGRGEAW